MPAIVKASKKRAAGPHSGGPSYKKPHFGKSAAKAASKPRRSQRITVPAQPDNDESEDDEIEDGDEDEGNEDGAEWVDEEDGSGHDDIAMDVDSQPAKDPNGECNKMHVDSPGSHVPSSYQRGQESPKGGPGPEKGCQTTFRPFG